MDHGRSDFLQPRANRHYQAQTIEVLMTPTPTDLETITGKSGRGTTIFIKTVP